MNHLHTSKEGGTAAVFFHKCINKPDLLAITCYISVLAQKWVIFKIDPSQIYNIVTFETSSYLEGGWDHRIINKKGFRMEMKRSMKYTFHFGFKLADVLENTVQPFPAD